MSADSFAPENRRRLVLKRGKERVASNRHPWIFAGAIAKESGPAEAAIADLVADDGTHLASGFHSLHSQIRLRALTFDEVELTPELLRERIVAAAARRAATLANGTTSARIVNAEGDELSGLVIDRYGDVAVVEIANAGLDQLRPLVIDAIRELFAPRLIYFKNDLPARSLEKLPLESETIGDGEAATEIVESDLRFHVDPAGGQKTGFFLDQRENRRRTRELASGRSTLNLFGYTGAFGVYAAAGGASRVENVDISAKAIEVARTNHDRNDLTANTSFVVADAFKYVREKAAAGTRFDLLICDPPAFARSRGDVERAARGYKDINLYTLLLANPGAKLLTFSCSGHMSLDLFQKVIFSAALDAGKRVSIVRRLTAGVDHPISLYCPEGEYLKGFELEVH